MGDDGTIIMVMTEHANYMATDVLQDIKRSPEDLVVL